MLRTQPPVLSPLSFNALIAASVATRATRSRHALRQLHELLLREYAADDATLTSSGTHALQLAIRAAVTSRDSHHVVALPAFSCFDVATAAIGAGSRGFDMQDAPTSYAVGGVASHHYSRANSCFNRRPAWAYTGATTSNSSTAGSPSQ